MTNEYWLALIGGAAAFAHCLGMCGPFALHLSRGGGRGVLGRQLLWQAGKATTYVFLGALAVQSGSVLSGMGIMAAMGVGTVWSLLLLGISGRMIGVRTDSREETEEMC